MVAVISRDRTITAAVFGVFATGAAVAQAANAPSWLGITFAVVAGFGAVAALGLLRLEQLAEREQESAERFAGALQLLGEVDERQGGIYLLEQIARDAPAKYQGPVVEVLTSYVRGHAPWPPRDAEPTPSVDIAKRRPPPDVQAALTVLGRRRREHDDETVQLRLSDVDLRGASLRGGYFEGVRLRRAHLEGARLEGANLKNAKLRGADLRQADLAPDPELKLSGADLTGAHLEGANLAGAKLRGAQLKGASFDARTLWPHGFAPEREGCRRVE
jgi:hypothetical protein